MKKTITVKDLCCVRCANRLADALELSDGVLRAKANYKKNQIFVEVKESLSDDALIRLVEEKDFEVISVCVRKGLFS